MSDLTEGAKSWTDVAKEESMCEDPAEFLEIDLMRWSPDGVMVRLLKVTNALVQMHKEYSERQKEMNDLGLRSGPQYRPLRGEQIILEGKIKSLERKADSLTSLKIHKMQEMKNTQ
jgi:hypothetical protein